MFGGGAIAFKNINIENGKYLLNDLNLFIVDGGKHFIKDNSIIIYPQNSCITITYNKPINIKAAKVFKSNLFIIILVLSYLLAFKLCDYLADFKTIYKKSRIDIIFLTTFFILLFLPMSHINNDISSIEENRTLAKWHPLINKDNEINSKFGKNFNDWFNDRFFMRKFSINLYNKIVTLGNIFENEKCVAILDKKFFYYKPQLFGTYQHLSREELESDTENLDKLNLFCKKHNIRLYLIIVPQKVNIYNEYIITKTNSKIPVGKQYKAIFKQHGINYIYPYEDLIKEKKENKEVLYYKSDTHLTDYGMYTVLLSFTKAAKKDFPLLTAFDINDFPYKLTEYVSPKYDIINNFIGDMNTASVNNKKYLEKIYKDYYIYPNKLNKIKDSNFNELKTINPKKSYKAFTIGSSYSDKFFKMLSPCLKSTYKIEQNNFREFDYNYNKLEAKILQENPDMLILIFNEGDAHYYLSTMYNNWEQKNDF